MCERRGVKHLPLAPWTSAKYLTRADVPLYVWRMRNIWQGGVPLYVWHLRSIWQGGVPLARCQWRESGFSRTANTRLTLGGGELTTWPALYTCHWVPLAARSVGPRPRTVGLLLSVSKSNSLVRADPGSVSWFPLNGICRRDKGGSESGACVRRDKSPVQAWITTYQLPAG